LRQKPSGFPAYSANDCCRSEIPREPSPYTPTVTMLQIAKYTYL
jgi:hypothetical protein